MVTTLLTRFVLFSMLIVGAGAALAGEFFEKDGVALRGYDPVAYFVAGKPQKGLADHSYQYKGSTFHFANDKNRRAFAENPEKYAPQYGGFCSFGTAHGVKVSTQPDAFKVVDGKLYLNNNSDIHARWLEDVPANVSKADKNWPEVAASEQKD